MKQYIYTYVQHEDERNLALLEQRAFFGTCNEENVVFSSVCVDPSRSPFMRERIEVLESATSIEELAKKMTTYSAGTKTFRVQCVNDILARHRLSCYLIEPMFAELYAQIKASAQNEVMQARAERKKQIENQKNIDDNK